MPESREIAEILGDSAAEVIERGIPDVITLTEHNDVLVYPEAGVGLYVCVLQKIERALDTSTAAIKGAIQQIVDTKSEPYSIKTTKYPERLRAEIISATIGYDRLTRPPVRTIKIARPCAAPNPRPDSATRRIPRI